MIWWAVFFIFIEYYSVGVMIYAKNNGMKNYGLCLIPFFAFFYMNEKICGFNVLGIKVSKWGQLTAELFIVCLLAFICTEWGAAHLTERNSIPLKQIMIIPILTSVLIFYLSMVKSTLRFIFLTRSEHKLQWLSCMLLLPIPFFIARVKAKVQEP